METMLWYKREEGEREIGIGRVRERKGYLMFGSNNTTRERQTDGGTGRHRKTHRQTWRESVITREGRQNEGR